MTTSQSQTHRPPGDSTLVRDVLEALGDRPRRLPTQYLYDARGSELFESITRQPEYYLTRTELSIYDDHLQSIAQAMGSDVWLIELGSGAGTKTMRLLDALDRPAGYTPIEISASAMQQSLNDIERAQPGLAIRPQVGDFTRDLTLPDTGEHRRAVFFPGSTLGNFDDAAARDLLARLSRWVGPGGELLIGVDLVKPAEILVPAYADAAGVTAEFNLNLLDRLNREAAADFDRAHWAHRARWNADAKRMESYLVSQRAQRVQIAGQTFAFAAGEAVWTEQSQKYTVDSLLTLAEPFRLTRQWTDAKGWFAVLLLEVPQ
jgi:dimethylhistidine N-methyltransferase